MAETHNRRASVLGSPLAVGGAGASAIAVALRRNVAAWTPALALALLWLGFALAASRFADLSNIQTLASQAAIPLILSTGLTFIVLQGSIDLSIEGVMAACSLTFALLVA